MRILFSLVLLVLIPKSYSQVYIESEPSWIVYENYNTESEVPETSVSGGLYLLLYSEQVNVDLEEAYIKSVSKAVSYSGIQNISTIVADYDPSYQKLRFHTIEVIREGKSINKLSYPEIQTARRETNAENFIYDGTISAFVNLPDVRIGDIVVYSYSIKGFNPIHKKIFSTSFSLNSTHPIDKLSIHIFNSNSLNYQVLNSELAVEHTLDRGVHHYELSHQNVSAMLIEEQTPSWFIPGALLLVSEYQSWPEVIDWGKDIFTFNEPFNAELQALVQKIKSTHPKEGDRISAALKFVQNEIRYLAVNSGMGGYKPNSPNTVISNRFGDCKDKSVLLTAMLNAMEIKAYPALVNTSLQQILPDLTPSSKLFDHCIVKVIDKHDTTLWYDPTLTDQGGAYNNTYIPSYNYGLVLDQKLATLDTIWDFANNMVEEFDTFKLSKEGPGAELEVRTNYYNGEADYMRSIFRNNPSGIIEKEVLKYYTELYGRVSVIAPLTFIDDSLNNVFGLLERYQLDSIWKPSVENPGRLNLVFQATNITKVLTMPNQLERTAPYALSYPMVRKQNMKILLSERIQAAPESYTINSDFFYYDFSSNYDKSSNILTLDYYYKNQADHVPTSGFDRFYNEMLQLDKNAGYLIMTNNSNQALSTNFQSKLLRFLGVILIAAILIGLILAAIVLIQRKSKS